MSDPLELYQQLILEHSRHPRHFGKIQEATNAATGNNPLCGDHYTILVEVDNSGCVKHASFEGSGCAISKASVSLMLDAIIGLRADEIDSLFAAFREMLHSGHPPEGTELPERLKAFSTVWKYPARVKCAVLGWHTLHSALHDQSTVTTER